MTKEKLKILAIDDEAETLAVLEALVANALPGAEFFAAENGALGLELAARHSPDVILLDIKMPGLDGFEVCAKLKAEARLKDVPVVFMTAAKAAKEMRVKALEAGGDGFIYKPLDEVELAAQVRAMARLKAAVAAQASERSRLEFLVAGRTRELERELAERRQAEDLLAAQNEELRRWQEAMGGRENRVLELKKEVNGLLARLGEPPRYHSAEEAGE